MVRRADAEVGFWGKGSAVGPLPSARRSGESCHYPHSPRYLGFARILWPCLSTVGGGLVPPPCPPRGYATGAPSPYQILRWGPSRTFVLMSIRLYPSFAAAYPIFQLTKGMNFSSIFWQPFLSSSISSKFISVGPFLFSHFSVQPFLYSYIQP